MSRYKKLGKEFLDTKTGEILTQKEYEKLLEVNSGIGGKIATMKEYEAQLKQPRS